MGPTPIRSFALASAVAIAVTTIAVRADAAAEPAAPSAVDALVSVASPTTTHPQNAQPEPPLAVDPVRTNVLVSGANDLVDMEPCARTSARHDGSCEYPLGNFNTGVGLSAAYFSFDRGHTWIQPTSQGLTAADCDPTVEPCHPHVGDIHTVPNFYENGLRSRSDTAVAFGPAPKNGKFAWANGSRLYFSTDATNLDDTTITSGGWSDPSAITVSHIDNVTPNRVRDQRNWSAPVIVPGRPNTVSSLDKSQIWADNAASSPYFGRTYVCFDDYGSEESDFPVAADISVSADGGETWTRHTVIRSNRPRAGIHDLCTVRTDSHGVAYMFIEHFSSKSTTRAEQTMVKSTDGGATWSDPIDVLRVTEVCPDVDPVTGNCVEDGIAGARASVALPGIDIANGAPTGSDATNEIVDAWTDGAGATPSTVISTSLDGGATWSAPLAVSRPADRPMFAAPAISPDGATVYVVYMDLVQPFQRTTSEPRLMHAVMRSARIRANGLPGRWDTVYSGPSGDARGSSQGRILYNEFLGDYIYAVATRDYGAGVWTDVRRTQDCPAMDAWRAASYAAGAEQFPAPWPKDCPARFGNSDIYSATTG